jgi:hypothetical protein
MSARARFLWIVPAFLLASWLAVRSLAAGAHDDLDDPQPPFAAAGPQIVDPSLAQLITRFADDARRAN